jgi:nitrogenase iron protein NifH
MIHFVPRDNDVQRAEINRKTVIEWNPECEPGRRIPHLAKAIDKTKCSSFPSRSPCRSWKNS